MLDSIRDKVSQEHPVSTTDAAFLYSHASDEDLIELASIVRNRFHDPDDATYLIMAIVNYTNVCVAKCDYCSFYRLPGQHGAYLLDFDQVCGKIDALRALGGTLIGFNGGFHPKLRIDDYAELFSKLRARYPNTAFYELTVAEFMFLCKVSKCTYAEGAHTLASSGTRWVTGGGAEILDDHFRKRHSPYKYTVDDYFTAQRAILDAGMGSTATMVIGFDETLDERLNHLQRLRTFQDRQQSPLTSFLCWTYKSYGTQLGGSEVPTREYLRWLATCRIYLHNFVHVRTSVLTRNEDAMLGLKYGANDFDLPTEDEVTQSAGATISHDFEQILEAARSLGFRPRHREPFPVPPALHAA